MLEVLEGMAGNLPSVSGNATNRDLTSGRYNGAMEALIPITPWFVATAKFDKTDAAWAKYIAWSGLKQLKEVVSLDSSLCPTVLPKIKPEYWNHIVHEGFMLQCFTELDYLRGETAAISRKNLLCVFRNPAAQPSAAQVPKGFDFLGYDLLEKDLGISALTNCGGFSKAFSNSELSEKGLLMKHERARTVQGTLIREYPNDPHADCHLWAIFRGL